MSEPTSALTLYGLILRVAREAGIAYHGANGDEPAMIPVDYHDFELCKRVVNDGIRMFIADAPPKGWRWMRRIMSVSLTATRITGTADSTSATTIVDATLATTYDSDDDLNDYWCYILTGTGAGSYAQITDYDATGTPGECTVADWLDQYGNPGGTNPAANSTFAITPIETVGGDITRYPLPENFGGEVDGQIKYEADSTHGTHIEWRDESLIRARQTVTTFTNYPHRAAIRPLEYGSNSFGPKRRFELIIDYKPSAAEVVEFPYTLFFDELRMIAGLASGGSATTLVDSSFANYYPLDYFKDDWKCYVISGTGRNARGIVTGFTGTSFTVAVADWLAIDDSTASATDATNGDAYYLEPLSNLHPAGFRFDQAILAACLAQAETDIEDVASNFMQKYMQKALPKAHAIDTRSAPRKLGSMNEPTEGSYGRQHGRLDATTDHDI